MDKADKRRFGVIMAGLGENFGARVSPAGIQLRFDALRRYSIEQIERAAMEILQSRKYRGMPTVADFVEHIDGKAEDRAEVECAKVLETVRRFGHRRSVVFDDPATMAVVQYGFGGWIRLCEECSVRDEKWFAKDFKKTWGAYKRQGVELHGKLLGETEADNVAKGYLEHIPDPVFIGNIDKAQAVMEEGNQKLGCVDRLKIKAIGRVSHG